MEFRCCDYTCIYLTKYFGNTKEMSVLLSLVYAEKNLGVFQWFKRLQSRGSGGHSPPDAVEFIHSQTAFIAIFVFCNTIYLTAKTGCLCWE